MQSRQRDFLSKHTKFAPNRVQHGGVTKGRRKTIRPLDRKKPLHLVLKSSAAKGSLSFLGAKNRLFVERTIRDTAKKFGVTVHSFQNVGNHLHAIVKFTKREGFQNFLRTATALIARAVTGARRGKPFGRRFWDALAFTRVINGRRDLAQTEAYLAKNELEREEGKAIRTLYELAEKFLRAQHREARRKMDRVSKGTGARWQTL